MMTVPISSELEQFIRTMVDAGHYASEEAVIDDALRLLQSLGNTSAVAELRQAIRIGIEEADRGELAPLDPHATLDRVRQRQAKS